VSAAQREKGKAAKFRLRPPMEGLGAHKLCKEGLEGGQKARRW